MNVNIALLTVTDTRTLDTDKSGNILQKKLKKQNITWLKEKFAKIIKKILKKLLTNG